MDVLLAATGGAAGWPEQGCSCASCGRARSGPPRAPGRVLVDAVLEIAAGRPPAPAAASAGTGAPASAGRGHRFAPVPGGWEITGPDGARLLLAAGPGQVPQPPDGAAPYDIVLLDLLTYPAQLGELRSRRLAGTRTVVAALYADHRITSAAELARRCELWDVRTPADGLKLAAAAGTGAGQASRPGGPAAPWRPGRGRVLLLGGARSGKSAEAELRMAGEPQVTYLAAGPWPQGSGAGDTWIGPDGAEDREWAQRVAAHRASRPQWWQTVESTDVAGMLRSASGALLIDGIGTWLAAALTESGAWAEHAGSGTADAGSGTADAGSGNGQEGARQLIAGRVADLVAAWRQTSAHVVAVSDQVGSGVVPGSPAGRLFRDQLGWLNQRLAAESEQALLVVAGRVTILPS